MKDAHIVEKEIIILNAKRTVQYIGNDELDENVKSMVDKINGIWTCKMCGHTASYKNNLQNHIESRHIEGLSHPCNQCTNVFKSRMSLASHVTRYHRE